MRADNLLAIVPPLLLGLDIVVDLLFVVDLLDVFVDLLLVGLVIDVLLVGLVIIAFVRLLIGR